MANTNDSDRPVVEIVEGRLEGLLDKKIDGDFVFKFLGVPYAEPPVGELRFKNAVPIKPWKGVKEAIREGDVSLQAGSGVGDVIGSENCLTLNVFTNKLFNSGKELYPVMVWIHSGGYKTGSKSTNEYGPEYLLLEDVILVCINYRLGIFGFLAVQDSSLDVPANLGLKDQILALNWIQKNIKYFSGDANNVTIFGNSAGGCSVELLLHSPLAEGLFNKVIIQSGSMLNPWVFGTLNVMEFTNFIGIKCESEKEVLDVLKTMPAKDLCRYQIEYCKLSGKPFGLGVFGAVVETPNPNALISETPTKLLTSKNYANVPIMIGYVANEGLLFKMCDIFETITKKSLSDDTFFDIFVPAQIKDAASRKYVCEQLKSFYFKKENILNKYEMAGDSWFIMDILASAEHYIKNDKNAVYLYRVSLDAGLNGVKIKNSIDLPGTCHGDDVGYLFKQNIPHLKIGESEKIAVKRMVKLWTNFAKYGNPTPNVVEFGIEWLPSDENLTFLDINNELTMQSNPKEQAYTFWRNILNRT